MRGAGSDRQNRERRGRQCPSPGNAGVYMDGRSRRRSASTARPFLDRAALCRPRSRRPRAMPARGQGPSRRSSASRPSPPSCRRLSASGAPCPRRLTRASRGRRPRTMRDPTAPRRPSGGGQALGSGATRDPGRCRARSEARRTSSRRPRRSRVDRCGWGRPAHPGREARRASMTGWRPSKGTACCGRRARCRPGCRTKRRRCGGQKTGSRSARRSVGRSRSVVGALAGDAPKADASLVDRRSVREWPSIAHDRGAVDQAWKAAVSGPGSRQAERRRTHMRPPALKRPKSRTRMMNG